MTTYWRLWAAVTFLAFAIPETVALATRHYQNTLSRNIWRLEQFTPGQPVSRWSAVHYLFGGMLITVLTWLIFHLVWGMFRG